MRDFLLDMTIVLAILLAAIVGLVMLPITIGLVAYEYLEDTVTTLRKNIRTKYGDVK